MPGVVEANPETASGAHAANYNEWPGLRIWRSAICCLLVSLKWNQTPALEGKNKVLSRMAPLPCDKHSPSRTARRMRCLWSYQHWKPLSSSLEDFPRGPLVLSRGLWENLWVFFSLEDARIDAVATQVLWTFCQGLRVYDRWSSFLLVPHANIPIFLVTWPPHSLPPTIYEDEAYGEVPQLNIQKLTELFGMCTESY